MHNALNNNMYVYFLSACSDMDIGVVYNSMIYEWDMLYILNQLGCLLRYLQMYHVYFYILYLYMHTFDTGVFR